MLSRGPRARCFSPSKNIRLKRELPPLGNKHYRQHLLDGLTIEVGRLTSAPWEGLAAGGRNMGQLKHILVIDDNGDVRDVIVDTLQEQHFRVSTASGGSTMRDFLDTEDMVDCVILDVLMPGEASASLALHLKERGIPLVMISGSPEAVKYAEDNGLQLLPKPFSSHELYSAVNMALASGEFGHRLQGGG